MYLMSLMLWHKINTVNILLIITAFDKQSIQGIINVFLEFLEILFFNPTEPVMDITEVQNFRYIIIKILEGTDDLQGIQHFSMFCFQLLTDVSKMAGFFLEPSDHRDSGFCIHLFGRDAFRVFQLFVKTVNGSESFTIRIDFQKR